MSVKTIELFRRVAVVALSLALGCGHVTALADEMPGDHVDISGVPVAGVPEEVIAEPDTVMSIPYVEASSVEEAREILEGMRDGIAPRVRKSYGPCTLTLQRVHKRTGPGSLRNSIGFKPFTKCDVPVSTIRHESRLKYKSWLWFYDVPIIGGSPSVSYNHGESKLLTKTIEYQCQGRVSTWFVAQTFGQIRYLGRDYFAFAVDQPIQLDCQV